MIAGCGVGPALNMWNVKLEPCDLNVYEFRRALGSSRVQGHASSPVPKRMLMSSASISVARATRCVMKGLLGHACGSNVALIHWCWCGLLQVCAVWFADQRTKVKLFPSSAILFAATICRLKGEAASVNLRPDSRVHLARSWIDPTSSQHQPFDPSDDCWLWCWTSFEHVKCETWALRPERLWLFGSFLAFWSGLGSRWSRAQILPGACWARDNLS